MASGPLDLELQMVVKCHVGTVDLFSGFKVYTCVIQMLLSLPLYLVSICTQHCDAYTKNLMSPVCVNNSYHLFSALSITLIIQNWVIRIKTRTGYLWA